MFYYTIKIEKLEAVERFPASGRRCRFSHVLRVENAWGELQGREQFFQDEGAAVRAAERYQRSAGRGDDVVLLLEGQLLELADCVI